MITTSSPLDTNDELLLRRHRGGIVLERPHSQSQITQSSINTLFSLPTSSYFISADNKLINANDVCIELTGAQSKRDFIGNTLDRFAKKELCAIVDANNFSVMNTECMKVIEETGSRIDDVMVHTLTFKYPWYYADRVIGVFGCSIPFAMNSVTELTNMISQLISIGLLGRTPQFELGQTLTAQNNKRLQLTRRENEIISQLIRGKTAKEIGRFLGISYKTVERHVENIKIKTGCRSRSELFEQFA